MEGSAFAIVFLRAKHAGQTVLHMRTLDISFNVQETLLYGDNNNLIYESNANFESAHVSASTSIQRQFRWALQWLLCYTVEEKL